jgi:hypothetical protein
VKVSRLNPALLTFLFILPTSLSGQSKPNKNDDYKLVVSVNLVGVLAQVDHEKVILADFEDFF